jgi:hypothetical protein
MSGGNKTMTIKTAAPEVKPSHTPTPWKMRQEIRTMPKRLVEDKKGITDFYIDGEPMMGLPVKKLVAQCELLNEANAAFIVRAVNCHEELLAAAKGARNVLAALVTGDLKNIRADSVALQMLRKAISQVEDSNGTHR